MSDINFREFFRAYVECALWSSIGDNDEHLDHNFGVYEGNISLQCYLTLARQCKDFINSNSELLAKLDYNNFEYTTSDLAGHDFWLTKEGHGAGFWDRGLGELGDQLTTMSKPYGSTYFYSVDGMLYCQ